MLSGHEEFELLGGAVSPEVGAGLGGSSTAPARFELSTWGSCRRRYLDLIHPVRLSLSTITRHSGTIRTDWFVIDVINMDSNRNMNREVTFIDVFQPIILYYHGALSCSKSFERVYLITKEKGGITVQELPIQIETRTETMGRLLVVKEVKFVEYAGERIVLGEREVSKTKTAYVVSIKTVNDKVVVSGDTYEIRETLKRLGLRWDPNMRAWVTSAKIGVENIRVELGKIPEVIVKEE
jgi:hypothetical protein